jgi:ankyrin repeat protein/tRNA A-37 threonylcarbamoyl transferase component Bud32
MIQFQIGQGIFAKVKMATDNFQRTAAIKIFDKKKFKDAHALAQVEKEIKAVLLTNHPNVVNYLEVLETKHRVFLVMENCTGGELYEYIQAKKRLREPEAARLFYQIVSAVGHCHSLGIIHRDLKPENILLDSNRDAKIVDFGLCTHVEVPRFGREAEEADTSTLLRTQCGSPHYAAPEILNERPYFGPQVDVWSLGVILFAMLCGKLPFNAREMNVLARLITAGRYLTPDHVSPEASNLIARILTLRAHRRPTCEQILKHEWLQTHVDAKTKAACAQVTVAERQTAKMPEPGSEAPSEACPTCAVVVKSYRGDGEYHITASDDNGAAEGGCTCGLNLLETKETERRDAFVEGFVEEYFRQRPPTVAAVTPAEEKKQRRAFFRAVEDGDFAAVTNFIEQGRDLAVKGMDDWTALHYAARRGHLSILHALLTSFQPLNIDAVTRNGWTPLMMAADRGHGECCQLMLEFGADMLLVNNDGKSAVFVARENHHNEIAVQMTKYIALTAKRSRKLQSASGVNALDNLLLRVAESGDLETLDHILQIEDKQQEIRQQKAQASKKSRRKMVSTPDLKLNVLCRGADNWTALHMCARKGHHAVTARLLPFFSTPDVKTKNGWTPLMMAADKGHEEVVRELLKANADPQLASSDGFSAISLAQEMNRAVILGLFQHALPDVNLLAVAE